MADTEREVRITISGRNMTGPEFEAARRALAGVRTESDSTSSSTKKLAQEYTAMQAAAQKVANAHGQVYTDLGRVSSLAQQFGGGNAIRSAEEYASAVTKVGGVSKLTAAEQAMVNRVVGDGIEKYALMGREAPAHLLKLRDETTKVTAATTQSTTTMSSMWTTVKAGAATLGITFGTAAVVGFATQVFGAAERVQDLSARLGVGAEAAQRLAHATKLGGGSIDDLEKGIGTLNRKLADGEKSTVAMLKDVGLEFQSIRRMKPEDAFVAVGDAIGRIPDPMMRANAAQELFGKSGLKLIPAMVDGYKKVGDEATVMSDKTVRDLANAKDAWETLWNSIVVGSGKALSAIMNFGKSPDIVQAVAERAAKDSGLSLALQTRKINLMNPKEKQRFIDEYKALIDMEAAAASAAASPASTGGTAIDEAAAKERARIFKSSAEQIRQIERELQIEIERLTLSRFEFERRQIARWMEDQRRGYAGSLDLRAEHEAAIAAMAARRNSKAFIDDVVAANGAYVKPKLMPATTTSAAGFQVWLNSRSGFADGLPSFNASAQQGRNNRMLGDAFGNIADMMSGGQGMDPRTPFSNRMFGMSSTQLGAGLGSSIMAAVQGGGNVGQAAGSYIGQSMGTHMAKELAKNAGGFFSTGLGSVVSAALPGIGALLGPLAGKLMGPIVSLFTGGEGGKANNLRDQLKAKFGDAAGAGLEAAVAKFNGLDAIDEAYARFMRSGTQADVQKAFDDLAAKMQEAEATMTKYGLSLDDTKSPLDRFTASAKNLQKEMDTLQGLGFNNQQMAKGMAKELNALVRAALDANTKIPGTFQPLIAELIEGNLLADDLKARLLGLPEKAKAPWQEMEAIMKEFGIDLKYAGETFHQSRLIEGGDELSRKWRLLIDNGVEVSAVNDKMTESAVEYLNTARRYHLEVPASMRPMLESMLEQGRLTDENGDKLESLGDVKWGQTAADQFKPLTDALWAIVDVFRDDLPGSLDELRRRAADGVTIPVRFEPEPHTGRRDGRDGDADGDGVPDQYDGYPDDPNQYASGGIAAGRQVALIAEQGRKEIVGDGEFMAGALVKAMARIAPSQSAREFTATIGGGRSSEPYAINVYLEGEKINARIERVGAKAAAQGRTPMPARAVRRQVSRG